MSLTGVAYRHDAELAQRLGSTAALGCSDQNALGDR